MTHLPIAESALLSDCHSAALGHHGKERLLGCLRDLTIDRISSNVESVDDLPLER